MKITSVALADQNKDEVIKLLIAALTEVKHLTAVLDHDFPVAGQVILGLDSDTRPLLISIDTDADAALLAGLRALDMTARQEPWLLRLYPALRAAVFPPRVAVMTTMPPPGIRTLFGEHPDFMAYLFRVITVEGVNAVLLDPLGSQTVHDAHAGKGMRANGTGLSSLTRDEAAFFDEFRCF